MKILTIEITNFGCFYGKHQFRLTNRGLTLVLGDNRDEPRMDSNGSGKSTLFDALDWCLFGIPPRGDHVDSIVNESGKNCSVVTYLYSDEGELIRVNRWRHKKSGVSLFVGDKDVTALDTKETQDRIEKVLGLDRDIFHAAVYYGQNDMLRFADVPDSARMDMLTKILQLDEIDEWQQKAKSIASRISGDITKLESQQHALQTHKAGLESMDYDTKIAEWEAQKQADIKDVSDHIRKAHITIGQACDSTYQALKSELHNLAEDPNGLTLIEAELMTNKKAVQTKMQQHNKAITMGVGECPECGQDITGDFLELRAKALEQEYIGLQSHGHRLEAQVKAARDREARRRWLQDQTTKREIAAKQAEQLIASLSIKLNELQTRINPLVEQKAEVQGKIDELSKDLTKATFEVTAFRKSLAYVDFWIAALSNKGLKSYILDSRLQELTDAANHWVGLLTGNTIWIRFESQKMTRGGKLTNRVDVRVFRHNRDGTITERNYKSWSGGEKQRVSLGIDFGLSRLIAARARHRYDLLILDELFKHLDQSGRVACVDMLYELQKEKDSVFVIDHDSDIKGAFENSIVVCKDNSMSTIVEGTNAQSSATDVQRNLPTRTPV